MALNFGKLSISENADSVLEPRAIFGVLPAKDSKYQYPRDVQAEVWQQWFNRRQERELVIKMNTGGGKTIVGLLILKSCLNEKRGPAVYVAPDKYLASQVIEEAKSLGLDVTNDPASVKFIRGTSILVVTLQKLINGKSIFGVGDEGAKIDIGSLVIDDAHACLAYTEEQFTAKLSGEIYDKLFALFRDSLYQQSPTTAQEVEENEPYKEIRVPYWAWIEKSVAAGKLLFEQRNGDELKFIWPLLKQHLKLCRCVFGRKKVEISPHAIPISVIPAIVGAKRRIFMSATLADDSVLMSHFDVQAESALNAICPSTATDIGDRMILVPQGLNEAVSENDLKNLAEDFSKKHNVVVLVPSHFRAQYWEDVADAILSAQNIEEGVKDLKSKHIGLVVIINRYDGIDLPQTACRILIIDGLPDVRRMIDKIDEGILMGSDTINTQRIQRIEQGMGRGIRSSDDYCLVLLMGRSLTNFLYKSGLTEKFTSATLQQFKLSEQLSDQLQDQDLSHVTGAIEDFLGRNAAWVKVAKGSLVGLKYSASKLDVQTRARREAFNAACRHDYQAALVSLQEAVNHESDPVVKGWTKSLLAEYQHLVDPVLSQNILKSAITLNQRVTRPMEGIFYDRLNQSQRSQSQNCAGFLENYVGNKLMYEVHSLLAELVFMPETSSTFEEAIKRLGFFLGFTGQRPELEFGKGPDNLWATGNLRYFVIECKNEAVVDTVTKTYCNQLNGSMVWFEEKYDSSCKARGVLIHPSSIFEYASTPHPTTRVITREKLDALKASLVEFFKAIAQGERRDAPHISNLLTQHHLNGAQILEKYSVPFKVAAR